MASIIRIKRSLTAGDPAVLGAGELAYSAADYTTVAGGGRLYIGIGTESGGDAASHLIIGGKYFTDKLDHSPGTLTASSALIVDSNKKIDDLYVDNLRLNGNTISSTDTNGNITLDPNGSGYVEIVGTNALVIPSGTTLQQAPSVAGAIRLNTTTSQFEGYNGSQWASLGGVRSVDGQTYITAEATPGAGDDTLRFFTNNTLAFSVDDNSIDIQSKITSVVLASTTASTSTTTGSLVIGGGVGVAGNLNVGGSLSAGSASFTAINNTPIGNITPSTGAFNQLTVDNIRVDGNTISSLDTNGDINITPTGTGKTVISNVYVGDSSTSLTEFIQDVTGGQIVAGNLIDTTYDDTAGTTTIAVEGSVVSSIVTDNGTVTPTSNSVSIVGGEGIDVTRSGTTITVAGELASTTNIGVASFSTNNFQVSVGGEVSIKPGSISPGDLSNSSITVGSTTIALGGTSTSLAGLTELTVDNLNFNGNTITSANANGDIIISPNGTGKVDVSGSILTGLNEPVNPTDAATKSYVDTVAEGLHVHEAAHCATTDTLAVLSGGTVTYANGTLGVGATLTLSAGLSAIDGHTLTNGDRILVKNQANQAHNGIYVRTSATVLTRASDFDTAVEIGGGDFTFVENGTLYASTGWVQTFEVNTVGTDTVIWQQFSGTGTFSAGNGLTISGTEFNVGGTLNRITVGVDSVDIASTYVGQNSITTLGTITTGTWNGTAISPTYGGTGVTSYNYGDILVGSVTGTLVKLSVGSDGKVLQSNGNTLVYGDVDGGTY
jgi:hypothetical protein